MTKEKYDRQVSLLCPTCGNSLFEYERGVDETIELVSCASCGRKMTKDQLIQDNSENISEHVKEVGQEVMGDLVNEFRKNLRFRKTFRGNKNIKFK